MDGAVNPSSKPECSNATLAISTRTPGGDNAL